MEDDDRLLFEETWHSKVVQDSEIEQNLNEVNVENKIFVFDIY